MRMFFELPPLDRATNFVRRGLLYLLFVTWNLPIAFQQTGLGMLTVFLFYTLFRVREFPSTPINSVVILYFGAMVISTVLSPDPVTSLLAYRKMWLLVAALAVFAILRGLLGRDQWAWWGAVLFALHPTKGIQKNHPGDSNFRGHK